MEKAPSSLQISRYIHVLVLVIFFSREQTAAQKMIRDNNVPCVLDFLE